MSSFTCQARRIKIAPHPDADAIELACVDDYVAVVRRGEYETGQLAVYVPEQAIVPIPLLAKLGLILRDKETGAPVIGADGESVGGCAGPQGNRVKAIRLRGVISQGLLVQPDGIKLQEGVDYAAELGIVKWRPEVPEGLAGRAYPRPSLYGYTDIENVKRFPSVLVTGEEVVGTEKLHGVCSLAQLDADGSLHISSKMSGHGLALEDIRDGKGEPVNPYWRSAYAAGLPEKIARLAALLRAEGESFEALSLFGETVGVQDLRYGLTDGVVSYAAFDLALDGRYLAYDRFAALTAAVGIPIVPLLYRGPFDAAALWAVATGKESYSGREANLREGVVVKPIVERRDPTLGRVILKFVSDAYLLRKGNTTEFE